MLHSFTITCISNSNSTTKSSSILCSHCLKRLNYSVFPLKSDTFPAILPATPVRMGQLNHEAAFRISRDVDSTTGEYFILLRSGKMALFVSRKRVRQANILVAPLEFLPKGLFGRNSYPQSWTGLIFVSLPVPQFRMMPKYGPM